jgi:DNA-binding HxlR family transcriptional regulator
MTTTTAAQRRADARRRYNDDLSGCPGHAVLAILTEKWVTLVPEALEDGPLRRGELARAVAGASQKMLTQTLRRLERDGLLTRTVTASVPVRVDYRLTELGRGLLPFQAAIRDWGTAHLPDIRAAREKYDRQQATATSSSTAR